MSGPVADVWPYTMYKYVFVQCTHLRKFSMVICIHVYACEYMYTSVHNKCVPIQSLTENLNKKESVIADYSTRLTQAEAKLKQVTSEKDEQIRALITEKAKLERVRNGYMYYVCIS